MRNAKVSKLIAAAMAATMLMSSATVFAADNDVTNPTNAKGDVTGSGQLEGYVDKNVFRVVLPTIDADHASFVVDPQGLLKIADSTKYTQEAGAVYFENAPTTEGGTATYSDKSDKIEFVNKSSYDVRVGLDINLTATGVDVVKDADLAAATNPSISLQLIKAGDTPTAVDIDSTSFKSADAEAKAVPEVSDTVTTGYKVTASETQPAGSTVAQSPSGYYYTYALTDDYTATDDQKVAYQLKGKCNTVAGWSGVNQAITTKIAWTVADARTPATPPTPSITGGAYSRSNTANTYTLANFAGKTITAVQASNTADSEKFSASADAYDVDINAGTLKIDGTKFPIGAGGVGNQRYIHVTVSGIENPIVFIVNVTA